MRKRILVLGTDTALRDAVTHMLRGGLDTVESASTITEGLERLDEKPCDGAVVDLETAAPDGSVTPERLTELAGRTRLILLTPTGVDAPALANVSPDVATVLPRSGAQDGRLESELRNLLAGNGDGAARRRRPASRDERKGLVDKIMQLSSTIELGRAMEAIRDPQELCQHFVDALSRELNAERVSLMLVDQSTGKLTIVAYRGIPEIDAAQVEIPLGKGIAGQVAYTGDYILVADVEGDKRVIRPRSTVPGRSFLSAPIFFDGPEAGVSGPIGVINVTNRLDGASFETQDLSYVAGLANQFAHALAKGRDAASLRRDLERLGQRFDAAVLHSGLSAVTRTASSVSDRLADSLSAVLNGLDSALELVDRKPDATDRLRETLLGIRRSALDSAGVVRRIRDFGSVPPDVPPQEFDVGETAAEVLAALRERGALARNSGEIRVTLGLQPGCRVRGNAEELGHALELLIENAADALPEGGSIHLRVSRDESNVEIALQDDGPGIPAEALDGVVEPYFTTRPGRAGLGATIAAGIAARHGGTLAYESGPDPGTTVRMRLPLEETGPEQAPDDDDQDREPDRILLVEDSHAVREALEQALELVGYEVESFGTGEQALKAAAATNFDLVVSDVCLPKMSGLELAERLRSRGAELPIVLLTGRDVMTQSAEKLESLAIRTVLRKPCALKEVVGAIWAELNATPANAAPGSGHY